MIALDVFVAATALIAAPILVERVITNNNKTITIID